MSNSEYKPAAKRCYNSENDSDYDLNMDEGKTEKPSNDHSKINSDPPRQNNYNNHIKKLSTDKKIYASVLIYNELKEFCTTKSPHILITRTFYRINVISIIRECPSIENDTNNNRKSCYRIKSITPKVKCIKIILL